MKKILIGALVVLGSITLFLFGLIYFASEHEIPTGETGAAAEALRDRIEAATALEEYRKLGAIEFTFETAGHRHFYDIQRGLAEVRIDDTVVQYDKKTWRYRVKEDGQPVSGADAKAAFDKARAAHINDVFWLNPFDHLRAPGIRLQKIGEQALLVTYESGGVTPGDSYLFVTDENYRPTHFKLWVSVIPIKGIEFSFEGWETFLKRVRLSLEHQSFVVNIPIKDVTAYDAYPEPGRPDRFAALVGE